MTTFYVSPAGDDDWSGTVSEPTAAGDDGPLETLDAARRAVRRETEDGMDGDVTVRLRGGTYYREEPLTFAPADGGRNGYEVRYTNYADETPVLVGGTQVTGWERREGGVYAAAVDGDFYALYENDERARLARHPNEGYNRVAAPDPEEPKSAFRYEAGDVPALDSSTGYRPTSGRAGRTATGTGSATSST